MIVYKTGDLLKSDCSIIVHGNNCHGVWGTGIAKAIKDRYPEVYQEHSLLCDKNFLDNNDKSKLLGQVQYLLTADKLRLIVNAFTQLDYGREKRQTSYDAVDSCFSNIAARIPTNKKIGMGKIGCVSAGGNWNIVKEIIQAHLSEHQIEVITL